MKRILFLFLSSLLTFSIYAQLNADHNSLRAGDVIIKQQVEYKDPGKSGRNISWDFSKLKPINEEYEVVYTEAPLVGDSVYVLGYNQYPKKTKRKTDLIVGTEHNTMYYYYQTMDSLLLIGHENSSVKQENILPVVNLKFPLNFENKIYSNYATKGLYSRTVDIASEGTVSIEVDAYGMMVVPSGDTINPVLRIKTAQTILDKTPNIVSEIENDKGRLLESYKWYSKGYRYPIFETVRNINLNDNSVMFSTAFFYPPQEHLYLDTDPDNLALLDRLWKVTEENFTDLFKDKLREDGTEESKLNYRFYPNPVGSLLTVEYTLENPSPVNILLYTIDGHVVKNIYKKSLSEGTYQEQLDCSALHGGSYYLKIVADNKVVNEKIIKK